MRHQFTKGQIALAVTTGLSAAAPGTGSGTDLISTKSRPAGTYITGDFHNHTTCSDGAISMQKLVKKSTDTSETPFGLDWFVQAGHGGSGNRNCILAEDATLATPAFPLVMAPNATTVQGPNTTWQNTNPAVQPKGRVQGTAPNQVMWRWQSIQEFQYPVLEYLAALRNQPLFVGVESVVAGHEHTSMSVITGQMPASVYSAALPTGPGYNPLGNATALSNWEYCFDRGDTDNSRGNLATGSTVGNNFDCTVAGSLNSADPSWDAVAQKLVPVGGAGTGLRGHAKTVEAVKWMAQRHPLGSYYIPAHLERAGPFNPNGNNGFNIEHLRDFNNAGPNVSFGFETQPGHGASDTRGEYTIRRNNIGGMNVDSVGGTTYGGTGVYGAQVGGVWDALLGEGRAWWFFASSDWHNRGMFGPDDRRSTQDFLPGEYQRDFVMVRDADGKNRFRRNQPDAVVSPQDIVDGLRTGNSFVAAGQLIDRLAFVACESAGISSRRPSPIFDAIENALIETAAIVAAKNNTDISLKHKCATMGEKLEVRRGRDVIVSMVVRDPSGRNFSPYSFANPSLAQVGINQPMDAPVLDHIDVIRGLVTGFKAPGAADYSGQWPNDWILNPNLDNVPAAAKNTSAKVLRTFGARSLASVPFDRQFKRMTFRIRGVMDSQYVRLRGTNLPAAVPFETDADGNPLPDLFTNAGAVGPTTPGGTDGVPEGANLRIACQVAGTNVPDNATVFTGTGINGCPAHLPVVNGQKMVALDVAAWADLWFYSNPIYIEVAGSTVVAGVK
jgi:hypothetical protein